MSDIWLLAALIFGAALLYSSVGHAGASGYLAAMALFGLETSQMRPAALVLNILVATIGTIRFARAGLVNWSLLGPFSLGAIPMAWLGGFLTLPTSVYRPIVGGILLVAAVRIVVPSSADRPGTIRRPPVMVAVSWGAAIGLLSGLTGTGGGIFLSPLLLLMRWAETKETSGVAAAFILANSLAGLVGLLLHQPTLPSGIELWAVAAACGGWIGSALGSRRLGNPTLRKLLAVVLVIAGGKMILA
ncbi:MAG: sulfite exporter TauE/SafE family protein [Gemmataceae bacterium]|nr:sulfite exporter TauE/SafE family protein [Gemmata sp.]MDW8197426.1 sulfite exporter TauE/SafE family protein [Gemmataceae bacterium]